MSRKLPRGCLSSCADGRCAPQGKRELPMSINPEPPFARPIPTLAPREESALLPAHYNCGPIQLAGADSAFYERHLLFDKAISPKAASPRDQFEAFAHSVRDILAQRWVRTTDTYARVNPKRVYYLSMEFLIG